METLLGKLEPLWENVLNLYWHDHVVQAYELALQAGLGTSAEYAEEFRLIEGEALTRKVSRIIPLSEYLSLEFVPDETGDCAERLGEIAIQTCQKIAERFHVPPKFPTLLAILARAVSGPWATNPHGYCEDKFPYEKICLPYSVTQNHTEFSQAVAHEYTHVISLNVSRGRLPTWLEEALSVLAEGACDQEVALAFKTGKIPWMTPEKLERAFSEKGAHETLWYAYQQAGWIGRYLSEHFGESTFGEIMHRMAKPRWWWALANALLNTTDTDWAVREVYGITLKELFLRAHAYLSETCQ